MQVSCRTALRRFLIYNRVSAVHMIRNCGWIAATSSAVYKTMKLVEVTKTSLKERCSVSSGYNVAQHRLRRSGGQFLHCWIFHMLLLAEFSLCLFTLWFKTDVCAPAQRAQCTSDLSSKCQPNMTSPCVQPCLLIPKSQRAFLLSFSASVLVTP